MRDIYHSLAVAEAIAPATYDADNTPAAISLGGLRSAMVKIHVGVGGITFTDTNKIEFKLTHAEAKADGSAPDSIDYVAVEQADVQGVTVGTGGIVRALTAAHAASSITRVGYVGDKGYLKLLADFGGTHSAGTPIAATVEGIALERPVAA